MTNFFQNIKNYWQDYMESPKKSVPINLKSNKIKATIQEAMDKKLPLHIIYGDCRVTGNLVKYDKNNGRIILKSFQKDVTTIIPLETIERISIAPLHLHL